MQRFRIERLNTVVVPRTFSWLCESNPNRKYPEKIRTFAHTKCNQRKKCLQIFVYVHLHCRPIVQCVVHSSMFSGRNFQNHSAAAIDGPIVAHFWSPSKRNRASPCLLYCHCCTCNNRTPSTMQATIMHALK